MAAIAEAATYREATADDLPRVVAMFAEFVATSQYRHYVGNDPRHSAAMIQTLIDDPDRALFVVDDAEVGVIGMLGLLIFTQPFSGERVASELFWWLDPAHRGHGGWLLKRGESWARAHGAIRMSMMAPVDKPRVAETYEKLGYAEVERIFQRDL